LISKLQIFIHFSGFQCSCDLINLRFHSFSLRFNHFPFF
jgi:hypothetical protein